MHYLLLIKLSSWHFAVIKVKLRFMQRALAVNQAKRLSVRTSSDQSQPAEPHKLSHLLTQGVCSYAFSKTSDEWILNCSSLDLNYLEMPSSVREWCIFLSSHSWLIHTSSIKLYMQTYC